MDTKTKAGHWRTQERGSERSRGELGRSVGADADADEGQGGEGRARATRGRRRVSRDAASASKAYRRRCQLAVGVASGWFQPKLRRRPSSTSASPVFHHFFFHHPSPLSLSLSLPSITVSIIDVYIYVYIYTRFGDNLYFRQGGRIYRWWIEGGRKRERSEMRDEELGKDVEEESRDENEREMYDK